MFLGKYSLALLFGFGILANPGFAQVEGGVSACDRLTAAYEKAVGEGKTPVHIISALESTGCEVPQVVQANSAAENNDMAEEPGAEAEGNSEAADVNADAAEEAGDVAEENSDMAEMDSDTPDDDAVNNNAILTRLQELEVALLAQVRLNAQNEAAIGRISGVVYNNQIPSNIRNELANLSSQISLMSAEQMATRGRLAQISELSNLDELKARIEALGSNIAVVMAGQAAAENRIDRLNREVGSYRTLIGNFLTSEVERLMVEGEAGACTSVSIEIDQENPGRVLLAGSVWKEELRQAILDIPLLAAFQLENRLNSSVGTLGCTESFGEYEIALDPITAAPLLAGKPAAIELSASLPASEQCEKVIADTRRASAPFSVQPRGFWVRDREGFVEACLQSDQNGFSVQRVTKRNDTYYILLVGDRL